MSDAPVKILDWGHIYQDSLTTEILRSERRRVTILAGLFVFAACVFTFFSFVPVFSISKSVFGFEPRAIAGTQSRLKLDPRGEIEI